MACDAMSFFQVKPFFLDFLFLFGRKTYEQGSYFSSFRHSPRLSPDRPLPLVGRSDIALEICYNLQGAERDRKSVGRPWSVRQTVVYHRLDLRTGACTWLFVKGNDLMKQRVADSESGTAWQTAAEGLSKSLNVHEMVSVWAAKNWRWYLDFLEDSLNEISRRTIEVEVKGKVGACPSQESLEKQAPQSSTTLRFRTIGWTLLFIRRVLRQQPQSTQNGVELTAEGLMAPPPPTEDAGSNGPGFLFSDLQKVLIIEEKVSEVLLVIEGNSSTMGRLGRYYHDVLRDNDAPASLRQSAAASNDVASFAGKLRMLESDMAMLSARSKSLLRLVGDRKTMVSCSAAARGNV